MNARLGRVLRFLTILAYFTPHAFPQTSSVSLIRNNDVRSLNPLTPPIPTLFDPGTGRLLGQQIPQDYKYSFYSENLIQPGDGPLVLYQLDDAGQTVFVFTIGDQLRIGSFDGRCHVIDSVEIRTVVNTVPRLHVEHVHAGVLYGLEEYPAAIVCEDEAGVLSLATTEVDLDDTTSVALVFHRGILEAPVAYIRKTMNGIVDFFNSEGGFRHDATDPANPQFLPLDDSGSPLSSPTFAGPTATAITECQQIGLAYHQCLVQDPEWLLFADALAERAFPKDLPNPATFSLCHVGGVAAGSLAPVVSMACALNNGLGFTALIVSGTGHVLHNCQSQIPSGGAPCSTPPGASADCIASATCSLNGGNGFAYCTYETTGPGSCTSARNCGGPGYCTYDRCWTDAQPEVCDAYDNDCDGRVDGFATTCGIGACQATGFCSNGSDSCTPGTPSPEICDNIDNDCDGTVDSFTTSCGVGACARTGLCTGGVSSCVPGTPAPADATCNGIDDDCDGMVDEEYAPSPTSCGVGACAAIGQLLCTNGALQDTCSPGAPSAEVCDGLDNDCDGSTDENLAGCSFISGCADTTREGFADLVTYPSIAACAGSWSGRIDGASAQSLCGPGWSVCSPATNPAHWSSVRSVSFGGAIAFPGCFPFAAADDNGNCLECTGTEPSDDMAGVGSGCSFQWASGYGSCLGSGRVDAECCFAYQTDHACSQNATSPYTGVVCCRDLP